MGVLEKIPGQLEALFLIFLTLRLIKQSNTHTQTSQHLRVRSTILLLCLVLLCTFVYVRMYVSVCV